MVAFSVDTFRVEISIESDSEIEKEKSPDGLLKYMKPSDVMFVPLSITRPEDVPESLMCQPPRSQVWLPELCNSNQSSLL